MPLTIALAGNPNCGKTTLFNAVTGANQFVGNWPGVTVEKKEGKLKGREDVLVADLPGIYSLSPYSPEERVARNYLVEVRPDVILNLVDGTSIERSLFLTTQFAELGIPMVVAINMLDLLQKKGDTIDLVRLSKSLGCPVLLLSAHTGDGVQEIIACALEQAKTEAMLPKHLFSGDVEHALAHIEEAVLHDLPEERQRYYALKLFERDEDVIQSLHITGDKLSHIEKDIIACEKELDDDSVSILTTQRYAYIDNILQGCVVKQKRSKVETSDRIDRVLTHRFLGLPIFAAILFLIYYISVSTVGAVALGWVNDGIFGDGFAFFGAWVPGLPVLVGNLLETLHAAPWISSLLLDGIIAGVGSVLGFVPQMLVLFFFLAFLEACGYMSRIAFIMDRVFRRFGLSGKSIIPILIGTGCGVPGIMASRTIENERDRKMTIITTTFIPCGAKLPIIAMISEALFENSWWVAPSAYFVGI
ncbi:MAG: ferrous iron transport protein B, partial [Clostridium sp.]|nr:ferrous iron transport protein B [Clostridium sp.]